MKSVATPARRRRGMSGVAMLVALVMALGGLPNIVRAGPAGTVLKADMILLTALGAAAASLVALKMSNSPEYQQRMQLVGASMHRHFVAGVGVVTQALRVHAMMWPMQALVVREVARDLGLNPDTVAPPSAAASAPAVPQQRSLVIAQAQADVDSLTSTCSCHAQQTYRGDGPSRLIATVFALGVPKKGFNRDLQLHALDRSPDSFYISTSLSIDIALDFAHKNGNVFFICSDRGIDVNAALGPKSPHPEQLEIAMPDGIDAKEVVGAISVRGFVPAPGSYQRNPQFVCY